jgi:hypothetical protein
MLLVFVMVLLFAEEGVTTVGAAFREVMGLDANNVVCLVLQLERPGGLLGGGVLGFV